VVVVQAYAIVCSGVRILCTNQNTRGGPASAGGGATLPRSTVLQTSGSHTMLDNIATIFGPKTVQALEPLRVELPLPASSLTSPGRPPSSPGPSQGAGAEGDRGTPPVLEVTGWVSKPGAGCGRAAGDRQFLYVNGRPVDLPRICKTLNECYRSAPRAAGLLGLPSFLPLPRKEERNYENYTDPARPIAVLRGHRAGQD